jgi:hypothetical protein
MEEQEIQQNQENENPNALQPEAMENRGSKQ